jgi:hypothetical protein
MNKIHVRNSAATLTAAGSGAKIPERQTIAVNADSIVKEDDWDALLGTLRQVSHADAIAIWSNYGNQKVAKDLLQSANKTIRKSALAASAIGAAAPAIVKVKLQAELAKAIREHLVNSSVLTMLDLSGIKFAAGTLKLLSTVSQVTSHSSAYLIS